MNFYIRSKAKFRQVTMGNTMVIPGGSKVGAVLEQEQPVQLVSKFRPSWYGGSLRVPKCNRGPGVVPSWLLWIGNRDKERAQGKLCD